MRRSSLLRPAVALAVALPVAAVLAGCAQRGETAAPPPASPAEGPARLVLEVEHTGGFVTPEMLAGRLPLVAVLADGRVVTQGAQIAIYPSPALPSLQLWQLDADGVQTVVDRAVAAGVTDTGDLGSPAIADAPSTRFTLVTDDGTEVREVYALGMEVDDPALTPEQRTARGALQGLLDVLTDPGTTLGAEGPEPYEPEAVAAVVRPWTADPDSELVQPEVSWPGPALPGEDLDARLGLSCVVARGDEADAVLAAAAGANVLTPWVAADGTRWALTLRPLLPHETGCGDLVEQ
ncbi:hypothetical protein [Geodermatophilus marinus]|uniref:hypothetical protein n=1 Tax=Geodermatophilus sp. LHW52908 TaxID=2303986 RepID=UPI000E3D2B25|nr:hypothetical protein [Geodermatophilus sp. LHW52908]RFU19754.1 hypothetical protein D0Z06_19815 [Geodermatophilus sp. LHW52908]